MPLDREQVRRILVIKLRAIGDVLMSVPVVENLRETFPEARIDFLTEREPAPVLRSHPAVDEVIVFDRRAVEEAGPLRAAKLGWRLIREVRNRSYDLVIDLFGNPRSAIVTWLSGAQLRVGFDWRVRRRAYNVVVPSRASEVHEVEFNLDALRALGIEVRTKQLRFVVSGDAEAEADGFFRESRLGSRPVIALNPGGGWATKRWPIGYFSSLAERIVESVGRDVLVLWGPGEIELAREVQRRARVPVHLLPQTDLTGLAAYIKRCEALVTNDSGPMHLAAALGVPTVAIFGPTQPELQGPWQVACRVVRQETLSCLGCNLTECRTRECMRGLPVEQVFAALADLLGLASSPGLEPDPAPTASTGTLEFG